MLDGEHAPAKVVGYSVDIGVVGDLVRLSCCRLELAAEFPKRRRLSKNSVHRMTPHGPHSVG